VNKLQKTVGRCELGCDRDFQYSIPLMTEEIIGRLDFVQLEAISGIGFSSRTVRPGSTNTAAFIFIIVVLVQRSLHLTTPERKSVDLHHRP
jgi:hypothetical protein